eukprot:jgi/Psemu1/249304/estExt_Genewise1Plus.C_30204
MHPPSALRRSLDSLIASESELLRRELPPRPYYSRSSSNNNNNNNNNNISHPRRADIIDGGSSRSNTVRSFKVMDVLRGANELQQRLDQEHQALVLHLEVGQPESGAPKTVADAAVEALTLPVDKKNVMGYTDAFGLLELRRRIREHYVEKYQQSEDDILCIPDVSQIVVTTGSSGAFLLAFTGCFDPSDTVAIASSGYPCYRNILSALGCSLATLPINEEYKLTATEVSTEIERRQQTNEPPLKGLILSSPSNPTGAMLTPKELKDLCALCNEHGIVFMSDEIYHGISYGNVPEATALQYAASAKASINENIVVINSFSKYYSMPGWRLGWMVVPQRFVPAINKLQQNMFINAPTVSQTAALKCWEPATICELETHVTKYRANRQVILDRFDSEDNGAAAASVLTGLTLETNVAPADGGFYVYVDLGETHTCFQSNLDSVALCEQLLAKHYVAFTPGIDFEDPDCPKNLGRRRFRISYAGGTENIRRAMDRFTQFWNTWWLVELARAKTETSIE